MTYKYKPRPGQVAVRPTEAHERAAHLFGWEVKGWASYEAPGTRSRTLLGRIGSDGHDPNDLLSVPTTGTVEEWIEMIQTKSRKFSTSFIPTIWSKTILRSMTRELFLRPK